MEKKLIPLMLLLSLLGCSLPKGDKNVTVKDHLPLKIKSIFPPPGSIGIAIDTEFKILFDREPGELRAIVTSSNYSFTTIVVPHDEMITLNPGLLPENSNLIISIYPYPKTVRCNLNGECISDSFSFSYQTGTSRTTDKFQVVEISPCQKCFYAPDLIKIRFNKPLSISSLKKFLKHGEKVSTPENTLIFYSIPVTIPAGIEDIYGEKLEEESVIKRAFSCFYIKEICTNPLNDWSDSRGGDHTPFDSIPGYGTINSSDQFILFENSCTATENYKDFYIKICDDSDCDYQNILNGKSRTSEDGRFLVTGDPAGTLEGGEKIKLFKYPDILKDEVAIPMQFPVKGGWWRDATTYDFQMTDCTIPF